jgi:hypothetical protein
MVLDSQDLENVSSRTLEHYNNRAADFWEGTRGHDVSQNIAALLQYIEGQPPSRYSILVADQAAISKRLKSWGTLPLAWKALRVSLPWQQNRDTRCGNRTS